MSTTHETTTPTQRHLQRAVDLAAENAAVDGGPFGAVVVTADGREFPGVNRVTADHDPTAHAEVMAIRSACRELGTFHLGGAVLYTSCEPCPLCLSASLWARLDAVYFAADRHDAAAGGFDDAEFHDFFAHDAEQRDRALPVRHVPLATRTQPFETWGGNAHRTAY
ncbi:nucleoside deaminase [Kocuria sp. CPCC 205292]|uniref:nucleoside deaminase n=1 Tax=Kocuria cellulosilytica TaxID=3071451 RepID=UPI0034D65951